MHNIIACNILYQGIAPSTTSVAHSKYRFSYFLNIALHSAFLVKYFGKLHQFRHIWESTQNSCSKQTFLNEVHYFQFYVTPFIQYTLLCKAANPTFNIFCISFAHKFIKCILIIYYQ